MSETLEGTIEHILFFNPDNGYSVLRFVSDGGERLTVVGEFPPLSAGERLRVAGTWEMSPKFGRQFKAETFIPSLPAGRTGIEKFLACGLIKGIGPVLAKRIVDAFGGETLEVLEKTPERMREVAGVGELAGLLDGKLWDESLPPGPGHLGDRLQDVRRHRPQARPRPGVSRKDQGLPPLSSR